MSLDQLVARLESATGRLEALAGGAPGGSGATSSEPTGEAVSAFDEIVSGPLKNLVDASQKIGGEIHEQVCLSSFFLFHLNLTRHQFSIARSHVS